MKKIFQTVLTVFVLFIFSCSGLRAQNIFTGTVYDADGSTPLPYAEINSPCLQEPAMADANGNFEIYVNSSECTFVISYSLYANDTIEVSFSARHPKVMRRVKLTQEAEMLDGILIVEERLDHDPATATTSITIMSPEDAGVINPDNAGQLVDKMPGVAVVDNEPQIRGGSGFSSGMGSRVLILVDNIPFLRPDAGRPMWSFIPMEDVKSIEVYKGASSVLFGSSALTGAINVLTAYPSLEPKTKVTLHAGIYDNPRNSYKKSWDNVNPLKWGASFLHSRIIRKQWDLVIGGEYFDDQSYIGPEYPVSAGKSNEGKYEMRARLNFSLRYRAKKVKNLSASLNGNFMYSENAQSFFWYDSDTNMYRTYKGSLSVFKEFMFYVDPCVNYISPDGSQHALRNRITYSDNREATGAQNARSMMIYDEYQFTKMLKKIGLGITAGIVNNYTRSNGCVFNGEQGSLEPGLITMDNLSIYAQLEKKFFKNKNLSLVVGGRWEAFFLDHEFKQKPIFRAGVNYQLPASMTSFRASFGQGYRYPTIGERFISISIGNYGFYPNKDLVPESSWNAEVGIAQPYRVGPFEGFFDVAGYYQHYKNFIEFAFGSWGPNGDILHDMGFMYLNTGLAWIAGTDVSLVGHGEIGPNVEMNFMVGYTYSHPITKNRDGIYYVNPNTNKPYSYNTTASDPSKGFLKYRIQHNAKLNLGFLFWKKLGMDVACTYYSAMKNVDNLFFDMDQIANPSLSYLHLGPLPFDGFTNYFNNHTRGAFTLDVSVSYKILEALEVSFAIKNILNNEYTLRPMYLEAPRNFTLKIAYGL
ncbi:MAG: TonB-dependent receptor [Bacteroidales bacterium]|nr:TonB-dependent receptor [Bacteroidales bacterium]